MLFLDLFSLTLRAEGTLVAVPFVVVIEVAASVARFRPSSDGIKP